ncbi:tartrate dehydrogenase/decarboxylase/D-malate dehydrogenase [Amycolatopsis bartoniae]|uniref:D-malate dehydrogenase (decarboxylating) n=1 Tax=Amycolatopsis bartoniae TaxID=941986 RepID=A0A8H9IQX2_9PSEU|nr:tartrate dehydrogenase [Amycolatopsis bartoniae]MBB2934485.1 tartrate dehydrogenase/decarboxylase/D-malate dehydrogenase [Amycolatopsis bartoniae]TVT01867.1 tartrate dehydrogenase [Amycolatopsis bartoniae]GHF47055.1 tartrate dehydrogenase [Amycolatopsis bartoniae]
MNTYRIASIPGDGIGVDVQAEARKVLDRAARRFEFGLEWTEFDWSCERYLETGRMMPEDGIEQLAGFDQILLGAVGFPGVPDHVSLWGLLIPVRRAFSQYVNLRPVRLLPGTTSVLRDRTADELEMVIVRENSEGEYSELGGRQNRGLPGEFALQESVFTRVGVERIVRYAFELAQTRTGRVVSATKSNGIIHTMPFWDEIFAEVAEEFPTVHSEQCHIDALAARMVQQPERIDVVVGSNLFGDILSDLAAAVTGGLGMAPSGNINPAREHPSMFEAVHGSAPDIAGQGIANPVAQILAGTMMLEHLGEAEAARAVYTAVEQVLATGEVATPDLGGKATTAELGSAIADAVQA